MRDPGALTRSRRLGRVYTLTLYGGAPPRRFRCERGLRMRMLGVGRRCETSACLVSRVPASCREVACQRYASVMTSTNGPTARI